MRLACFISVTDEQGTVTGQGLGQSDITLTVQLAQRTDDDNATPVPRSVIVSAAQVGAFGDSTGKTVLIRAGANITSQVLNQLATMNGPMGAVGYHMGIPQFADIEPPHIPADQTFKLDVSAALGAIPTPYGNIVPPNIRTATMTENGKLKLIIDNANPGQFKGTIVVRALFGNGSHKDVKTIAGDSSGAIEIDSSDCTSGTSGTPPKPFALGTAR